MKTKYFFSIMAVLAIGSFSIIFLGIQAVNKAAAIAREDGDAYLSPSQEELLTLENEYQKHKSEYQLPQQLQTMIQINRILEKAPAQLVSFDPASKYVEIKIHGWMTDGSDAACEAAAKIFNKITSLGVILKVQGEFVPSSRNPMDNEWTKYLVSGVRGST